MNNISFLIEKLDEEELIMRLKYFCILRNKFIVDLKKYRIDELQKLIIHYDIDVNDILDEDLLEIAKKWYEEKQLKIDLERKLIQKAM
jgi:hypothetical protein